MKALKLIFFGLSLIIIIGLVVWLSDPISSNISAKVSPQAQHLVDAINARWDSIPGWNKNAYSVSMEEINRDLNDKLISSSDEKVCLRHLNELALRKTIKALDNLYASPSCSKSQVDSQFDGLKIISAVPGFENDADIKRHKEIYALYCKALAFASKSYSFSPNYSFPDSWRSFSGAPFSNEAASIRNAPQWDVIKDISTIKNGLSSSTVNAKIQKAKNAYASSLSRQIISAYSAVDHDTYNASLGNTWQKFHNQGLPDSDLKNFYYNYTE